MYSLEELYTEIEILLSTFMLQYKKVTLSGNSSDIYVVHELGMILVGIDPLDYSYIMQKLLDKFPGYRYYILSCDDSLLDKKDEILWDLMRSGYIRYIRYKFQRQFNNMIQQGLGRKIITERLRIWGNTPKYKYLVEENRRCLDVAAPYLVAQDPAFFDFMPEIPQITNGG
jgi:hypothetical protein